MPLKVGNPERVEALNYVAKNIFHEWDGVRYDSITASGALEEMKINKPRVLFVALGETDDWAHKGRYDRYLLTANQNDGFIRDLYETAQSIPEYKDNTLFIVTSDHGRGDGREGWKNHSVLLPGSERIWIAAFGPGLSVSGMDEGGKFEQAQVAATVAKYLGLDFGQQNSKVRPPLPILK
jgi:phosphopentomutase